MYLKSLRIHGFKTFGKKVQIDFQRGVTAIVGPNGAGKTNLIDALNWVTGETRLSDLRVKTADQLIFHGSPNLKPLSLAEVSLVIDNSDNQLPIEFTDVQIARRISRDGTSEYFLNKNKCALRDITNLFMDTGVGRGAYSIMRQGEIDRILRQKPEERREIFEEAAGILKYRTRRRETERDLERAEGNLKQIRPTMLEVERQFQTKKKQAERAEKYNQLADRRFKIEVDINLIRLLELKKDLATRRESHDVLVSRKQEVLDKLKGLEQEIDDGIQKSQDLQHNQHRIQGEILAAEGQVAGVRQKIALLEEKKLAAQEGIRGREESLAQNELKLKKIDDAIAELSREKGNLEGMVRELQDSLGKYARDIEAIGKILADDAANIEQHRARIAEIGLKLNESRVSLEEVVNRLVGAIDKRKAELRGTVEQKQDLKGEIELAVEDLAMFLKSRRDMLDDLARADFMRGSDKIKEVLTGFRSAIDEKIDVAERLRARFADLDTLISGFDEIIFAREGIHAQKEALDTLIAELSREEQGHRERITFLETDIANQRQRIETIKQMMHETQVSLAQMREKLKALDEGMATQRQFRQDVDKQSEHLRAGVIEARGAIKALEEEAKTAEREFKERLSRQDVLKTELSKISKDLSSITAVSSTREKKARELKDGIEQLHGKLDEASRAFAGCEAEIRSIYANFTENFSDDLRKYEAEMANRTFDMVELRTEQKKVKEEIRALGQINLLAIDECKELEERYKLLKEQIEDIEKSRKNLMVIIEEINKNSEEVFNETFNRVKTNFHKLFRRLFDGGKGELILTDPTNLLESGVEIMVQPPSKALQSVALLSGGESSMTAVALLFAIFMVRPSPFCLLDEIDAALDGPNIERFKKLVLEFRDSTQFLMISHNINTLKVVDALYGISMEEDGVTTALSLNVNELDKLKKKYEVS